MVILRMACGVRGCRVFVTESSIRLSILLGARAKLAAPSFRLPGDDTFDTIVFYASSAFSVHRAPGTPPVSQKSTGFSLNRHALVRPFLPNTVGLAFDTPHTPTAPHNNPAIRLEMAIATRKSHGFDNAVQLEEKSANIERRGFFEGIFGNLEKR